MSLRSSRMYGAAVPTMPPGLVELMEGLAKDVLKNSPDKIYEFCAQHMKKLIEIRDGKARKNDSASIEKMSRSQENDRRKAEKNKNVDDTEMVAVESNDKADKKEIKDDEKQIPQTDENYLKNNDESEKEIEIEHKQFLIKVDTYDSNKTTTFASVDHENAKLPREIRISETEDHILHTFTKSLNENSMETSLTNDDLASSTSGDIVDMIEPIVCTTNIENENTTTNTTILLKTDYVGKDENQTQHTESFDYVTDLHVDKSILENTEDDLNRINDLDNSISLEKDSAENEVVLNESNNIHVLKGSFNDASIQNNDCLEIINHPAIENGISFEDGLHLQKLNETQDSSKERYTDVDNESVNSMDLEKAAITIQKVFRAFLFKSKTLSTDEVTNIDLNYLVENEEKEAANDPSMTNKERRSGISRMDTVLQTVNEEKSLSLSTDDSSTLSSAATIIQAHVRGFLVRCKMPFNKTISTVSVLDSDIPSAASFDSDQNQQANKTILNIHIVPEGNNFISRDESLITSLDLSLDGSPRHSSNLHPLGYDRSERRKQLKREDAIQSVTPPSNNSGKLSEEVDSVKEIALNDSADELNLEGSEKKDDDISEFEHHGSHTRLENSKNKFEVMKNITSDEADVVTPLVNDGPSVDNVNSTSKLLHSGEFHDIVLPTVVSRSNSSVVREFQNVLVYFLLWNPS